MSDVIKSIHVKIDRETFPKVASLSIKVKSLTSSCYINYTPTCNCQLFSIGDMENLLFQFKNSTKEVKLAIFSKLRSMTNKSLMLIDIKDRAKGQLDYVLEELKEYIVILTSFPYTSSNGSLMHQYLLNLEELPYFYELIDKERINVIENIHTDVNGNEFIL